MGIDRHGFFHEDVRAGADGGVEMDRPEVRGRREQHEIDITVVEETLIRVKADVTAIFGDGRAARRIAARIAESQIAAPALHAARDAC